MRKDFIEDLVKPYKIKSLIYDYSTLPDNNKYRLFKQVISFLEVNADFRFVVTNTLVEGQNEISIWVSGVDKKKATDLIKNK